MMEQPKRPPNASVCFMNEKRAELFTQVPPGEKKVAWVAKKGGEMWKAMSEEERAPYVAQVERLQQEFEEERQKFTAQGGVFTKKRKGDIKDSLEVEENSSSTVVPSSEMEQPKRPPNASVCFMSEKRAELFTQVPAGEKKVAWVAKKGGEMWKALSEEERAPYVAQAERLQQEFEEERQKFIAQGGVFTKKRKGDIKDSLEVEEEVEHSSSLTLVLSSEMEQPKILPHACVCLMNETFAGLFTQVPAGERTAAWVGKKAAEMWKALCEADRAAYVEQAECFMTAFEKEFEKCDSKAGFETKAREVNISAEGSSSSSTTAQAPAMEQPKRPLNPCAIFMNEKRPEVKKQMPAGEKKPIAWVMKQLGNQWNTMSQEERAPYVAQYESRKKEFDKEREKFIAQGGVMTKPLKKRKSGAQGGKGKRREISKETVGDCNDPATEKETEEDLEEEKEAEEEEAKEEEEEIKEEVKEEAQETEEEEEEAEEQEGAVLMAGLEAVLQADAHDLSDGLAHSD